MYKFSVVIPAYNAAKYLHESLGSLFLQTYQNFEIVIVDDGSKDNTSDVINSILSNTSRKDVKVQYIKQENKGCAAARNKGITAATGEYICFLDADDSYEKDSLQLCAEALSIYDVDVVFGKTKTFKKENAAPRIDEFLPVYKNCIEKNKNNFYLCNGLKFQRDLILKGAFVHINAFRCRKDFLIKLGMFDERVSACEDTDLFYRTFFAVKEFIYIDKVLSSYNYYYVFQGGHRISNINIFFKNERTLYIRTIKLLIKNGFPKDIVSWAKRRICARKFKYRGMASYRQGKNLAALRDYYKSLLYIKNDREIWSLIFKTLVPYTIRKLITKN